LPFASKPKLEQKKKKTILDKRPARILEPKEKKEQLLIQMLNTIKNDKIQKKKLKQKERAAKYLKTKAKDEVKKHEKEKVKRRDFFKKKSKTEIARTKRQKRE